MTNCKHWANLQTQRKPTNTEQNRLCWPKPTQQRQPNQHSQAAMLTQTSNSNAGPNQQQLFATLAQTRNSNASPNQQKNQQHRPKPAMGMPAQTSNIGAKQQGQTKPATATSHASPNQQQQHQSKPTNQNATRAQTSNGNARSNQQHQQAMPAQTSSIQTCNKLMFHTINSNPNCQHWSKPPKMKQSKCDLNQQQWPKQLEKNLLEENLRTSLEGQLDIADIISR